MKYYKNEEDAALCINDSFIKICSNIGSYDQKHSFSTWSKTILTRTIIDDLRKTKKYRETMINKDDIELMNVSYEIVGADEIDVSPSKWSIKSAMTQLPDATKKVFSMFVVEGYSHADIADELGITVNTSKWHVKTAKKKLKEIISDNSNN